jgi:hypothetical protein
MNKILEHVLEEHKSWAETLTPKDMGDILNMFADITVNNSESKHITNDKELSDETEFEPKNSDISAVKGLQGETKFEQIVSQYMSIDYKLVNTAKIGKAGDFIITWHSQKTNRIYKILIDVKNYSKSTVPTSEIEKFHRDVNMNNVDGGFLISLKSRIIGCSQIIELKDLATDSGIIPLLFTQSYTPLLIVEVIKLLFHIIEIKDLNKNSVCKNNELVYHINQLNDNIQMITDCREILQTSKTEIEKSLNAIMLKLMSCEYSLVSKINRINTSLVHIAQLSHTVDANEIKELEDFQSGSSTFDIVKTVRDTFSSLITEHSETLLYIIYNLGWDDTFITTASKTFSLVKGDSTAIIKFTKSNISITFPSITESMHDIIQELKSMKKLRKTGSGFVIKISADTVNLIAKIHEFM